MKTRSMTRSQTLKDSTHDCDKKPDCDEKPDIDCCKLFMLCKMYNSPYFSSSVTKRSYKINNKDSQLKSFAVL